jgi:hypothetical protein
VLERGDRLLGRVHGDQRGDGEAIAVGAVLLRQELVVDPTQGDAFLLVVDLHQRVAEARVQHREVDPGFTEAIVVAPRRRHRRVVVRLRRHVPRVRQHPTGAALLHRQVLDGTGSVEEPGQQVSVSAVAHVVDEHGHELDDVAIAVEHRMAQLLAEASRASPCLRALRHRGTSGHESGHTHSSGIWTLTIMTRSLPTSRVR